MKTKAQRETCSLEFSFTKNPALGPDEFEGMASVFNAPVDAFVPTIIEPGAFKKTLSERYRDRDALNRVKILFNHDDGAPIGRPISLEETAEGLKIHGKISDTNAGRDVLTLLKDRVLDSLSIGFDPIQFEYREHQDDHQNWRHIKEIRLWEVSVVTFPANAAATITDVHAVVPFQDLPLADEGRAWDGGAAHNRLVDSCGLKGDSPDWAKFRKAHLWYDSADAEKITSYKFNIADIIDGKMLAVPRGIFAAAVVLQGGRGGTNISEDEQAKMKAHLSRYYRKMDRTAPWDEEKDQLELTLEMLSGVPLEAHVGKVLSAKNKKLLQDAVAALQALIATAEPPDDDKDEQALTVEAERLNRLRDAELALAQLKLH